MESVARIRENLNLREKLDVCLVWPGTGENVPPFGPMSIASILEQNGFTVKIADFSFEELSEGNVRKKIQKEPFLIGMTVYSTSMIARAVALTHILKKVFSESFSYGVAFTQPYFQK